MPDFSNLGVKRRDTTDLVVYSDLNQPTLTVRYAGETNKAYYNEVLRFGADMARRRGKPDSTTVAQLRERDRKLFPKHVIVGWKGVKDASGAEVPFSVENCEAYVAALDWSVFDDEVRDPAKDLARFGEGTVDTASIAGNSPTG